MKSSSNTKPEAVSTPAAAMMPVTDEFVVEQLRSMCEIADDVAKLEKMPREKYDERAAISQRLSEAKQQGRLIGNYESLLSKEDKDALGPTIRDAVIAIYGESAVENVLLKGIANPNDKIDKRIKFLKFLAANLISTGGKSEFRHFEGEYDPKKSAEATVKMGAIFSEKAVELYRAAVREEGESAAFRLALAYKAVQYFKGPKLQQLMYVWVGGASGSGKSFGANGVILTLLKHMRNVGEGDTQGNYFAFVDGGIARQLSQPRKLALNMVLRCGFSSIEDLNDISGSNNPLDLKKVVHNMAVESGRVNVIIPETFSECAILTGCKDVVEAEKLTRKKKLLHVFTEVAPPEGKVEEFKTQLVPRMAGERANRKEFGEQYRQLIQFDQLNTLDLPCESKAPPSISSIGRGLKGTANAREVYLSLGEDGKNGDRFPRIHIVILNELIYIDYLGVNQSLRIAASDFANYQKAIGNTPTQQLSLQAWYQEMKRDKRLAPALIMITRFDVDADRREFCQLMNEAASAAGLAQPELSLEKEADKTDARPSKTMTKDSDPEREMLIRRLAHFANVLTTKEEIPYAARAEMLELTGKRICQLIFTGVPHDAPTKGAEINVVRDDSRKFAEWMALLNRALRHSLPEDQAEARRLLIKEWQAQILQSYAPVNEKAQALQDLHLCAKAFLTQSQVKPAPQVAILISDIESNIRKLTGVPVAPQRNRPAAPPRSEQSRMQAEVPLNPAPKASPQAPPRNSAGISAQTPKAAQPQPPMPERVVKKPVPPPRASDPAPGEAANTSAPRPPVPPPRANSAQPVKQEPAKTAIPAKLAANPSGMFAHPAPASTPNKPPARPTKTAVVTDEAIKTKSPKTP